MTLWDMRQAVESAIPLWALLVWILLMALLVVWMSRHRRRR